MSETTALQTAIRAQWRASPSEKAKRYIGQFFESDAHQIEDHWQGAWQPGTYVVSIESTADRVSSGCSCYVGKGGFCHHCEALAHTFLQEPSAFREVQPTAREAIRSLADLQTYLQGVALQTLLAELKASGITPTAFAASIGINTRAYVSGQVERVAQPLLP